MNQDHLMIRLRRTPKVFRYAAMLLVAAAVTGHWWQKQPAGSATTLLLATIERNCPPASVSIQNPTIADGARALDRWSWRVIEDHLDHARKGGPPNRCASPNYRPQRVRRPRS